MDKVVVLKCNNYNEELIQQKVDEMLSYYGGIKNLIQDKQKVVLKVNLVCGAPPEKMCTTHPSIVKCLAKRITETGAECIIADSPGGPFTASHLKSVYNKCGMSAICEEVPNVKLNDNFSHTIIENEENKVLKTFNAISVLNDAEVVINITKCKTHTYMGYTGAVKNMFGIIPGLEKVEMHSKFVSQFNFGDMLIDLNETFKNKIVLNIVDAVIGMEGAGPTGGTPKEIGLLMCCSNPYYLDAVQTKIMSKNPLDFPLINCMINRNLIPSNLQVEIVGDAKCEVLEKYDIPKIEIYSGLPQIPKFVRPLFHKLMSRRPVIKKGKCRGCGKCFEHCPAKAISMQQKSNGKRYAQIDYNKCIRCFCCQELCPFTVVKIRTGILHKIIRLKPNKK